MDQEMRKSSLEAGAPSEYKRSFAWDEFLAELFEEWDGHWTESPH